MNKKDMPAMLYGATALIWLINAIVNRNAAYFALAALFFSISVLNFKRSKRLSFVGKVKQTIVNIKKMRVANTIILKDASEASKAGVGLKEPVEGEQLQQDAVTFERRPWYETADRICTLLGVALIGFLMVVGVGYVFMHLVDQILAAELLTLAGDWIREHPVVTVVLLVLAFGAFMVWFVCAAARRMLSDSEER